MNFSKISSAALMCMPMQVLGEGVITFAEIDYKVQVKIPIVENVLERYLFIKIDGLGTFAVDMMSVFEDILRSQINGGS